MSQTVKALHEKRMKLWDASISNHKRYMDPSTGRFKEAFVEYRKCPVCSQDNYLKMFDKEGGTYVKCLNCSMVYLNPVFTDTALTDYYVKNHSVQARVVTDDISFYRRLYNKGLDSIEAGRRPGHILDVGCSSGLFLDLARKRGWQTYGIELNRREFDMAQKKGHAVYDEPLEKIRFAVKFNAIALWDVFEHIKDGSGYLTAMKHMLGDNGVIFMQIPSSDALAARVLQDKCNMFDGLEHVNLYGVDTFKRLVNRCGLSVFHMQTVISEIGVLNNYLNYDDPYMGASDKKTHIPGLIDHNEIHRLLWGYKLQAVIGEAG